MSSMLLEAKELHTYYGASHILHGIDFHIRQGEGIALMGRNGMGKSTLIKSMLGIVRPRHGQVLVRGDDFTRERTFRIARRGIAYVPEGRGIFPNLSVRENLQMSARAALTSRGLRPAVPARPRGDDAVTVRMPMAKKPVRKSSAKSKPAAKAKKPTRRKPAPKPAAKKHKPVAKKPAARKPVANVSRGSAEGVCRRYGPV